MNSPWQAFFDQHAPVYDDNVFTKNTAHEVDFVIEELGLAPGAAVLDVGCGTGRHSVELAQRGYAVTGVDLSPGMLAEAQKKADAAGVKVGFVRADATSFSRGRRFDGAICLCEGAFGLLSACDDPVEQPLSIVRNISAHLKPGARALLTVLSAYRMARRHAQDDVEQGVFDPVSVSEVSEVASAGDMRERGFVPTELALYMRLAGMKILHIWGGTAGSWNKGKINLDEYEIMIVAEKAQ